MQWRGVAGLGLATAIAAMAVPASADMLVSDSTSFLKAVRDRDGNKATELLEKPASGSIVGTRDPNTGESALHIVTKRRDLTWLQFMLSKGCPVNQRDNDGNTALSVAAQLGWPEGATQLIQVGATIDQPNARGETPLILATEAHSLPMVSLLVAQGADPHLTDNVAGMSAIDYATRDGRSQAILRALQAAKPKPKKTVAGPSIGG